MPKTKIICTIGPATDSESMLRKMINSGMNVARLNFSHGTHQSHKKIIDRIKKINKTIEQPVAILLDTSGPEIRTTECKEGSISLNKNDKVKIGIKVLTKTLSKNSHLIGVNYRGILKDVKSKSILLLDNGILQIKILRKDKNFLYGIATNQSELGSKKHVNVPGAKIHIPTIGAKDKKDILFGLKLGIDFIAISFVRSAQDIRDVKKIIPSNKKHVQIIAKVEHPDAVDSLEKILDEADGVMVARGDLAMELPFQEIPILQRKIVNTCLEHAKPVIIATQMLESMVTNPFPTRAEISDIANAVLERTDAIMLSGETTMGKFPIKCVKVMKTISKRIEEELLSFTMHPREHVSRNQEVSRAACLAANNLNAAAILVFTEHGKTARNLSNFRPKSKVYAFSNRLETCRRMNLYWGIKPHLISKETQFNTVFKKAIQVLQKDKVVKKGDTVIIVSNILTGFENVDTVQVKEI